MVKRKYFVSETINKKPRKIRDYRKKRTKDSENIWKIYKEPKEINCIRDLIAFAYTNSGKYVDTEKLKNIVPHLLELDNMVGLNNTKKSIMSMIMHFCQNRHAKNKDYLHMVVYGPPGCGKTSFCRIIGKILSGLGVLPKDTFTVVKRTDLIGKYLGQTAHKTSDLLNKVKGGVMFIDEAYSLAPRNNDRDSFAKEAIDFLNQFLSEHKDDLVCIVAGYEQELNDTFFAMNEGLSSRFPWKFSIDPYSSSELLEIMNRMLKGREYSLEPNSIDKNVFENNKPLFTFSGRDIENFISKCIFIHTRNTFGKEPTNVLTKKDIEEALIEQKKIKNTNVDKPPPFGMYI